MSATEQTETANPDQDGGTFSCGRCSLTERYSYYGRSPRFLRKIVFLEDCYVIQNPFTAAGRGADGFVVLGSHCVACGDSVCQGPRCSIFYAKRFCMDCARANISELPQEVFLSSGFLKKCDKKTKLLLTSRLVALELSQSTNEVKSFFANVRWKFLVFDEVPVDPWWGRHHL